MAHDEERFQIPPSDDTYDILVLLNLVPRLHLIELMNFTENFIAISIFQLSYRSEITGFLSIVLGVFL